MGLGRVAIAAVAVVLATGLLIVGGVALWGALNPSDKPGTVPQASSSSAQPKGPTPTSSVHRPKEINTLELRCLVVQCRVYVAGPASTDVLFNGSLTRDERRIFDQARLTLVVSDASAVSVIINGRTQPRGAPGRHKTYHITALSR